MSKQTTKRANSPMASDWTAVQIVRDVEAVRQERIRKKRLAEYRQKRELYFSQNKAQFDLSIERVA